MGTESMKLPDDLVGLSE